MIYSPVKNPIITQRFGENFLYYFSRYGSKGHSGIDLSAKNGNKYCYPSHEGIVTVCEYHKIYGNRIIIRSYNGEFETLYAHLEEIYVKKGDSIKCYKKIGKLGNTGASNGIHLHFGYRPLPIKSNFHFGYIDPEPFLSDTIYEPDNTKTTRDKRKEPIYKSVINFLNIWRKNNR